MSEPIARHQMFEYNRDTPFHIYTLPGGGKSDTEPLLLNHWHEELEIVYAFHGNATHYIDGKRIPSNPGRLIVVNSESIHNIVGDDSIYQSEDLAVVILIVSRKFMEDLLPNFGALYFLNQKEKARTEIRELMMELADFQDGTNYSPFEKLYIQGLVMQLIYYMSQEGVVERDEVLPVNYQKNIERMKGVLQYIELHYAEKVCQSEVAERFYFSKEYFARFFKKHTGMTFIEFLTRFRLQKAKMQLQESDDSILTIALNHGFSDDRRLILAFKKQYGMTPFQYRKKERKRGEQGAIPTD